MRRLIVCALAACIAFAPALAEARVGSGASMGSRGSMTWSSPPSTSTAPNGGSAFQRSYTPYNQGASSYGGGYGYGGYGMRPRSGFASGLLGGFIGAGLGGMLFGRGFFGGMGGGGGLGFLGFLLQMALLFFAVRWLIRRFAGAPAFAGMGAMPRTMNPQPGMLGGGGFGAIGHRPLAIGETDYQAFERLLREIQAAWSAGDLNGLHGMATPEMVGYFGEQLAELSSRGLRNQVTEVRLQQGDLAQAWSEGSRDYATVAMRFSMIDATRDRMGQVVDGSLTERVTITELWTFLRAPGGHWILSAIQQAR